MPGNSDAYAAAGVNIESAGRTKRGIAATVRSTFGPEVLADIGGFGGLYAPQWDAYRDPVLVAGTDGVGTKLKIAFLTGIHHTVGADLVAHCANDILVQGARPLFFMDYLSMGKHDSVVAEAVIEGIANGCKACGCALLGGEMAEMPDFYAAGEYDLAGTIVGIVNREDILDVSRAQPGDKLIGLPSCGLHTNGYSLARRLLFETAGWTVDTYLDELGGTIGETLLAPHRSYVASVFGLMEAVSVRGMAHITGGGILDNLPRTLPEGLGARIFRGTWPEPPVFNLLQRVGDDIHADEMFRVFNMGLGLVLVVPSGEAEQAVEQLNRSGEDGYIVGEVVTDPTSGVQLQ
ncbi:MAG: phosphoribosylformylglycinamidine cyclo-ligase [Gemmatimonadota bacterium]|nr:phosphoribosylformylglycinamidine cyclo-ligase [Gemmatimonadota bacterium]